MRTIRVHLDQSLAEETEITLPAAAARHLTRVLRLRAGARIQVFNGDGREFPAEIVDTGTRQHCRIRLDQAERPDVESAIEVTLVQAIGRGERMDWCIQKSTELGVARIQPVFSERTEVRLDGQRAERRQAHWQQVAVSAAEQSGRVRIPRIDAPVSLQDISNAPGLNLVLDPQGSHSPADLLAPPSPSFSVVIGPEGGLSADELRGLEQRGYKRLRLGARILRTETAGPAILALLQTRFGDWS
ncbi:16S rRNA (uracil(1498)-N(3))-methyltransferase [Wenzhouxiangella limi]|uniref:Ribosomal RNA small subunit methyltransferase E n=1 Tax=Wenzhouxiangella limi TaxID=2707351 RepID=A0A845V2F6_9GAMM|nr:16S rRNA (uracil(1498)-N(3))-methyltransferase [Wenzhouxiangella limi]NDY96450.1 16S rRNA (uracil(1498)-N(3))-methyltransferase [Wenzhouxiangella limi]